MHPVLFQVGPIIIYSFSFFLALGLFLGAFIIWKYGRHEFSEDKLFDGILICFLFSLFVGRIFFVFSHFDFFSFDILKWILFMHYPGFSFWGVVLGALLGLLLFTRSREFFARLSDLYLLGFSMVMVWADLGCILSGCSVGKSASLPWSVSFTGFMGKRHPVSLYALILDLILLVLVFKVLNYLELRRKELMDARYGLISLFYVSLFLIIRGVLEFYKEKTVYLRGVFALALSLLGIFALIIFYKKIGRNFKEDLKKCKTLILFLKCKKDSWMNSREQRRG